MQMLVVLKEDVLHIKTDAASIGCEARQSVGLGGQGSKVRSGDGREGEG